MSDVYKVTNSSETTHSQNYMPAHSESATDIQDDGGDMVHEREGGWGRKGQEEVCAAAAMQHNLNANTHTNVTHAEIMHTPEAHKVEL